MPDISMCRNEKCPSKEKCYRYTAKPNEYGQAYSQFSVNPDHDKCDYFVDQQKVKNN
jgi:hypothetical protein